MNFANCPLQGFNLDLRALRHIYPQPTYILKLVSLFPVAYELVRKATWALCMLRQDRYTSGMTSRDQVINNIDSLIQRIAPLNRVLAVLGETSIRYGLYAGSHVAVLTNNRPPTDVDFLVHDDDIDELKRVFPFAKSNESEYGTFVYIGSNNLIEFMGRADIHKDGAVYPFRLTDLAFQHVDTYNARLGTLKTVNPVDTLLLKAVLRRGQSQGKNDLEDIMSVLVQTEIDKEYLKARMDETKTEEYTKEVWRRFGIHVQLCQMPE